MARKLIGPVSWAALICAFAAFGAFRAGVDDAFSVPLLHLSVLLAVMATGARLAAGAPVALPAAAMWTCGTLFTLWALASRRWAVHPLFVGHPSYLTVEAFFFFLLLPQLLSDRRSTTRVAAVYLAGSTALAVGASAILLAARAGLFGLGDHSRYGFAWPTGNPNFTALILEPGLLLAVAAASWTCGARRWGAVAAAALHLAAILLTNSSGALVGLGVGGLVLVGLLGGRVGRWLALAGAIAVLGAVGVALDASAWLPASVADGVERSLRLRRVLAVEAIDVWRESPRTTWVGHGLGSYLPAVIPHKRVEYYWHPERATATPHPHGLLLRVLAELGLVGALLLVALIVATLLRARALVVAAGASGDSWGRRQAAVALAAALALLAHGQLTVWLDHALGLFLWWGWLGVLAAPLERTLPAEHPRPALGLTFAAAGGGLLAGFFGVCALTPMLARLDWRAAQLHRREVARALEAAPPDRHERMRRDAARQSALLLRSAAVQMTQRGETERTLRLRVELAMTAFRAGDRRDALNVLLDLDRRVCPGYGIVDWRIASAAAIVDRRALANEHFLRHFDRMTLDPDPYEEWRGRDGLHTDPMCAAVEARLARAIEQLERGAEAGQLAPGDRRLARMQIVLAWLRLR